MKIQTRSQIETEIRNQIPQKIYDSSPAIRNLVREQIEARIAEQAGNQHAASNHRARAARIADRIGR